MPLLMFMRHGNAQSVFEAGSDAERQLTEQGKKEARATASLLKNMNITPQYIIASTYQRAQDTAAIVAEVLDYKGDITTDQRLLPQGRSQTLKDLLADKRDAFTILLVGHEPSISHFVSSVCANDMLSIHFDTANICGIHLDSLRLMRGTMLWFLKPECAVKE